MNAAEPVTSAAAACGSRLEAEALAKTYGVRKVVKNVHAGRSEGDL